MIRRKKKSTDEHIQELTKAVRALIQHRGYAKPYDIATIPQVEYSAASRDRAMIKTAKAPKASAQTNGRHANGKPEERQGKFKVPTDNRWEARVARAVNQWRMSQGLSVPKAAEKYGIHIVTWYKIEKGTAQATTGLYLDKLAELIGLDVAEILKLGKNPGA